MKELIYISCQPNSSCYCWQVNVWLESARRYNIEDKCHILVYNPDSQIEFLEEWKILEKIYIKAQFFYYRDEGVRNILKVYIPILRPHTLFQHFTKYPELKDKAIFYHDCDIMLTQKPDIDKYLSDDINYVSDTVSKSDYMSHKYFESKRKDVLLHMLEEYDTRDVLAETANLVGITKEEIVNNYSNTGGAQYLLKNITAEFWDYVQSHSIEIVLFLRAVNRKFFASEDKGYQSWCADMWAVLWGLWAQGRVTRVVPELNFCWATDVKAELINNPILHNAGVTSESTIRTMTRDEFGNKIFVEAPAFYKGRYSQMELINKGLPIDLTPFKDEEYVNNILSHPISSGYCFHAYLEEIMYIKHKYDLSY